LDIYRPQQLCENTHTGWSPVINYKWTEPQSIILNWGGGNLLWSLLIIAKICRYNDSRSPKRSPWHYHERRNHSYSVYLCVCVCVCVSPALGSQVINLKGSFMTTPTRGLNGDPEETFFPGRQDQVTYLPSQVGRTSVREDAWNIKTSWFVDLIDILQGTFIRCRAEQTGTWRFLTPLKWPTPGSVASTSSCSGGREASTSCSTKTSCSSVECTCSSVCSTGRFSHFNFFLNSSCSNLSGLKKDKVRIFLPPRFLLTPRQQDLFERVALYCDHYTNTSFIPVLFVLGESDCCFFSRLPEAELWL